MGVYRTDYLMFGIDMGAKDFNLDDFEPEVEGAPVRRFDIVYDGMCGKYCLAGQIIAKSDPSEGIEMTKIDLTNLNIDRVTLARKVSAAFGRLVAAADFSLILFSHFS